jgi:hypothetical protein
MVNPNDETGAREEDGVGTTELSPPDDLKNGVKNWNIADIQFVLPAHRGAKLMLENVRSYPRSNVIGSLRVIGERCVGFTILEREELVLTGPDLIEMATQLLGVWGYHYKELFAERHRTFLTTTVNRAKFHKPVKAGETVCIEIAVDNIRVRVRETPEFQQFVVHGSEFIIKVGNEVRGRIGGITLMSIPKKKKSS